MYRTAMLSLTRFTMGRTTAVAMPEIQQDLKQSSNGDASVVAAADNIVGVVQDRVVEPESRDRKDERAKEPGTHDPPGSLLRLGRRVQSLTGSTAANAGDAP